MDSKRGAALPTPRRRASLASLGIALAAVALLAYTFALRRPDGAAERAALRHDAELGWVNAPSLAQPGRYGAGKGYTTNAAGLRAREEYAGLSHRRRRVAFAGDGYTLGAGVGDDDSFPALIERLEPRIQSVNLGVADYGADQSFLRVLRESAALEPALVVLAFGAQGLRRMQVDRSVAPKPMLALEGGNLVLRNQPVPEGELGPPRFVHQRLLGWLRRDSDPGRDAASAAANPALGFAPAAGAMLDALAAASAHAGRGLLLVYLPMESELEAKPPPVRAWASEAAAARGIAFLDAAPVLAGLPGESFLRGGGAYSETGNALVAAALLPRLRELLGLAPSKDASASAPAASPASVPGETP